MALIIVEMRRRYLYEGGYLVLCALEVVMIFFSVLAKETLKNFRNN